MDSMIRPLITMEDDLELNAQYALLVDVYTLARMFRQYKVPYSVENLKFSDIDFNTVIVFAGHGHIQKYVEFFNDISNSTIKMNIGESENDRCQSVDKLAFTINH